MSKFKKGISLLFALIIILNCMVMASAAESGNIGVSEVPPIVTESGIQPYGTSKPSSGWNLATKGRYNFKGNSYDKPLYSNYYITGVSAAKLYIKNLHSSNQLEFKLLKVQFGIDWSVYDTEVTPRGDVTCNISNLDPNEKYILRFEGPSDFEGYIEKA